MVEHADDPENDTSDSPTENDTADDAPEADDVDTTGEAGADGPADAVDTTATEAEGAEPDDPTGPDDTASLGSADVAAERDEYLDALRRVKAEFDNFRKRTDKERESDVDKRVATIVADLLPVLDACDAAVAHGDEGVAQIRTLLLDVLAKGGLETLDPAGQPFDPNQHEAVMQEEGDGERDIVVEVLRGGYTWRGRVVRPAMVKVRT